MAPNLTRLNAYAFPTEARFADTGYAREIYRRLARELIEDSKVMSTKGTGSMGIYKVYSRFKEYADQVQAGKDPRGTFVSKLDDPDAYGAERVALYNVSLDEVPLVNWERKTIQKDEVPFTFTRHKYMETA